MQLRDDDSGINITTLSLKIDSKTAVGNTSPGMSVQEVEGGYDITYTPQEALGDGAHTITVNVSDNDGNAANTVIRSITVDTTPPTLDVTSPQDNLVTNKTALTVSGTTSGVTSGPVIITIKLNQVDQGAVTVESSGTWSKAVTLQEGENTIVVTATDRAGKTTAITRTVTLNTTAPKITKVEIAPNPVDAGATYTIRVTVV